MKKTDYPTPNLGYFGPNMSQKQVCQEVYDYLVIKKLMKLQEAVVRLNTLIKEIAR